LIAHQAKDGNKKASKTGLSYFGRSLVTAMARLSPK